MVNESFGIIVQKSSLYSLLERTREVRLKIRHKKMIRIVPRIGKVRNLNFWKFKTRQNGISAEPTTIVITCKEKGKRVLTFSTVSKNL